MFCHLIEANIVVNKQYYKLIFLIIIGGVTFGYNISSLASTLPKIKLQFNISEQLISFIVGLVFAGTMCAKFFFTILNDAYGRRKTLIISCVIFLLGTLSFILSTSSTYIVVGRLLQGVGGGLLMATTSIYIVEIANDKSRGKLTALYQLSFTVGLLLANIVGLFMYGIAWKIIFVCLFVLTLIFLMTIYNLPCSPRWLFRKGFLDEAKASLALNHSSDEAAALIKYWQNSNTLSQPGNIFQMKYLKVMLLVISVTFLNQLTGINAILQTSTILMKHVGSSINSALIGSVGITAINVVGTIIGLQLIDKFKRNLLLGYCGLIIACAHLIIALDFFLNINSPVVLFGGLMLFILAYSIGPGIIIWLVFSEYLPMPVRSQGVAITGFLNSFAGFMISSSFLNLIKQYGISWMFLFCSLCSVIFGLIPILFLPDTNGKNLEQFDELFKSTK